MLFSASFLRTFLLVAIVLTLLGCGEKAGVSQTANKLEESERCMACHPRAKVSPVTQKSIYDEWKLSAHNTGNGASCGDCHVTDADHVKSSTGCSSCHQSYSHAPRIINPDAYGSCAKCHTSTGGFNVSRIYDGATTNTLTAHFSTPTLAAYTSGKFKARYVTKSYERSCRSCHNPHDTTSQIDKFRQWARSGKGDVTAKPWTEYDFRTRGTTTPGATPANSFGTDCVRCHTATGHINYLTDGSIAPFGTSKTEGKEVLACNVCHTDYSYARRQIAQVTAYYNKSTVSKIRIRIPVTYKNLGESNLCLNCHVGRETGKIIKELAEPSLTEYKLTTPTAAYNFKNVSFENSHYLTAGATIFRTSGFEFYSSQYYNNPSYYAHDQIGVSNYNDTGTSGPCITCHMKPGNHTFRPVAKDGAGNTVLTSTTCNNTLCHNGSMSGDEVEHQKKLFNAAMDALSKIIQQKLAIYFYNASPYFYTKAYLPGYVETYDNPPSPTNCSENQAVKNWQTGGTSKFTVSTNALTGAKSCRSTVLLSGVTGTGALNMGAAFNYNLLYHDFGAFAHNRIYAKRLIYDSISWLFDNDKSTAWKTTTNTDGYLSDVEAAIQSSTLTDQQKNDACTYLFTGKTYTVYIKKDPRNWRPGSSASSPVY